SVVSYKIIHSRQSVPQHSIFLLYWFAHTVRIDDYDTITVPFNPNTDYGSHHYGNYEYMLSQPPRGYQYYTVGNLNKDVSNALPHYIRNLDRRNRGRIIFRAETSGVHTRPINQVYLTQHVAASSNEYDPDLTYRISTNLLRQISQIPNQNELWRRLQTRDDNFFYHPQSMSTGGTPHQNSWYSCSEQNTS
uniref:Uncharacterized protein n=1 Tax=Neogobius melanostomus TaxID=47308 RepID=A0A8C6U8E4_9GOBI